MSKVFEDAFMEIQTDMVQLGIEICELANNNIDGIYIYCLDDDQIRWFNAFFTRQGKIVHVHELGVDFETQVNFINLGLDDLRKVEPICKQYNQPAPTEMKLVYDIKNRKFSASYQYGPVQDEDTFYQDLMTAWENEVAQAASVNPQASQPEEPVKPQPSQPEEPVKPQASQPEEPVKPKKPGFRFPFWKK